MLSKVKEFIEVCESYQGTPFHHQGRVPHVGLDCVGLPICAAREVGITLQDNLSYDHEPSAKFLYYMIAEVNNLLPLPLDDDQPGDILLMRYTNEPTHVAVRTFEGIVHAYAPMRKTVLMPLGNSIKNLIVGRFRYQWPF